MILQQLSELDVLYSIFRLVFVIISLIIGGVILSRYSRFKRKSLITVGLTWIFMTSGWWGGAFSFLAYLLSAGNYYFGEALYLFLGNAFLAAATITWIYSFGTLTYPKFKKPLLAIYTVIGIAYEIFLISFLFIDISLIGSLEGMFSSQHTDIVLFFYIFAILTFLTTGILFSKKSLEADDKTIKLKGKFLLAAFISFAIGAILDTGLLGIPSLQIIGSIILMLSAFEYYLGFLMPDKIADSLIKS